MMTFNNFRILHSRSSYNIAAHGDRIMETGYIDWDEARSRRRVLMEDLGLVESAV